MNNFAQIFASLFTSLARRRYQPLQRKATSKRIGSPLVASLTMALLVAVTPAKDANAQATSAVLPDGHVNLLCPSLQAEEPISHSERLRKRPSRTSVAPSWC
ncbi:hypothetical protein AU476_14000 [Cupriavidus sp. UYMSc13B]|nr:hypothetical protein AU476_14000 [Cupriavidus sp. UYMSc13B]